MSYSALVLNVMIASPSDVPRERVIIRDVIVDWNTVNAKDRHIVLMPVGWETHSTPEIGNRPQAIINGQLLKDADLLVAVFGRAWAVRQVLTPVAPLKRSRNISKRESQL